MLKNETSYTLKRTNVRRGCFTLKEQMFGGKNLVCAQSIPHQKFPNLRTTLEQPTE